MSLPRLCATETEAKYDHHDHHNITLFLGARLLRPATPHCDFNDRDLALKQTARNLAVELRLGHLGNGKDPEEHTLYQR